MIENKKISVIIPVYNVENYLKRCVDSVLNQTFGNLEVILVDDGATDNSPAICDGYASIDGRVKVIHRKNGGLSSARNAALDSKLTGDFVAFIDSDDWIEPDMYEYMIGLADNTKADVVEVKLQYAYSDDEKFDQPKENINIYDKKQILDEFMDATTRHGGFSCCINLFRKELLDGVRFREGKKSEDMDFKYIALSKAQRYVKSNQLKYYYFQHGESISTGGLTRKDFELYEAALVLKDLTDKEKYGNIKKNGEIRLARVPFSIIAKMAYYGLSDPTLTKKEVLEQWMPLHRENLWTLLKAPIPVSRKVLSVAFAINFSATSLMLQLVKDRFIKL